MQIERQIKNLTDISDKVMKERKRIDWGQLTVLVLPVILHSMYFTPALNFDDWSSTVYQSVFGGLNLLDPYDNRPLGLAMIALLHTLFGLDIAVFHYALVGIHAATAWMLYRLLLVFPVDKSLALFIVLIYSIHPADGQHMDITTLGGRTGLLLTISSLYLLHRYLVRESISLLLFAVSLQLLSFFMYEIYWALYVALNLLFFVRISHSKKRLVWSVAIPLWTAILFFFWRVFLLRELGIPDAYFHDIPFSIFPPLDRFITLYRNAVLPWLEPLRSALGFSTNYLVAAPLVGIAAIVMLAVSRFSVRNTHADLNPTGVRYAFILSIVFILAGFVPLIFYAKNSITVGTYLNMALTPGYALFLSSLLALLLQSAMRKRPWRVQWIASCVSIVIYGLVIQLHIAKDRYRIWDHQKNLWSSMFELTPGLAPNTHVVCDIDMNDVAPSPLNFTKLWPPLVKSSQMNAAIKVLYNDTSITASLLGQEVDTFLTKSRFKDGLVPVELQVLMRYSVQTAMLELIEQNDPRYPQSADTSYRPRQRILSPAKDYPYRYLVAR